MPIDTSFLLGAKPVELPNPLEFAKEGVNLSTMASMNAIRQLAAQEAQRKTTAEDYYAQQVPALLQANFSPQSQLAALQNAPPGVAGLVQAEAEKRAKAQADVATAQANAYKAKAEGQVALLKPISNMAWELRNDDNLTPDKIRMFANSVDNAGLSGIVPLPSLASNIWSTVEGSKQALGMTANATYDVHQRVQNDETQRHNLVEELQQRNAQADLAAYHRGSLGIQGGNLLVNALEKDPFDMFGGVSAARAAISGAGAGGAGVAGPGGGFTGGPSGAPGGAPTGMPGMPPPAPGAPQEAPGSLQVLPLTPDQQRIAAADAAGMGQRGIDAATGKPLAAAARAGAPGQPMSLQDAVQSGLSGQDLLNVLPPGMKQQVQQLLEGRGHAPTAYGVARSGYLKGLMMVANLVDPEFSEQSYALRYNAQKAFSMGNEGQNLKNIDTATGHLGAIAAAYDKLNNTDFPWWNWIGNPAARALGDKNVQDAMASLETAQKGVAGEMAKVFRNSGMSVQEISGWESAFSAAKTPTEQRAIVRQALELLQGRKIPIMQQWQNAFGTSSEFIKPPPYPFYNPAVQQVGQNIENWINGNPMVMPENYKLPAFVGTGATSSFGPQQQGASGGWTDMGGGFKVR